MSPCRPTDRQSADWFYHYRPYCRMNSCTQMAHRVVPQCPVGPGTFPSLPTSPFLANFWLTDQPARASYSAFLDGVSDQPGTLVLSKFSDLDYVPRYLSSFQFKQILGFVQSTMRPVIQVSAIRKTYGSAVAVDDVSFEVNDGEIFGLIGPNGAGKTTTMECIEGLRTPDRGAITVLGLDPFKDVYKLQERIGVQLQQAQLQKRIKVWEAVDLWASLYQRNAINGGRLLEQLGLIDKRNAWFMTLSGGQKQRLFIALALINDPELVFLDELTTGLDPQARRAIWDLVRGIRERGKTVFLTTHLMEEVERLCDRVAIIEHGRIIDIDSPESLVKRHCPERTVVLATDDGSAADRFRAIPRVEAITCSASQFTIRGSGDDLVTEVIQCLSENRIRVTDFRTILPNLEDVFLKLTGHSIRD